MNKPETLTLARDVEATVIPFGSKVTIKAGMEVSITQSLGDSFTVNAHGTLVRIEGKDADALGKEPPAPITEQKQEPTGDGTVDKSLIWEQLKTCYDPEIPVNIADLGLIYDMQIVPLEEGGNRVAIAMTLTAPGCGMGPILCADVESKVSNLPNVTEVTVQLVFDPPWTQDLLSDEAKLKLGLL